MQCKFLPIALSSRIAATLESTPPESPRNVTFTNCSIHKPGASAAYNALIETVLLL